MRTTSRLIRTVLVASGLLAISASAAQAAMPIRQSNDATDSAAAAAANRTIVFHRTGFLLDNKLPIQQAKAVSVMQAAADSPTNQALASVMQPAGDSPTNQALVSVMQPAADSPTDQTVPLVINQPVPAVTTVSAGSGFDWTDAAIGAAVAALLLILAAFGATRVRPRQTATL
jgi:hypothetical protein